jgi:hypothetical protein
VADQVRSIQGIAKSVDDLLKATTDTLPAQVGTEEQLLDRITSFLYGLEFLGIMQVEKTTSLLYLEKLREFKRDYPGLPFILFYDKLFRTEVDREIKKNPLMTFRAAFINLLHRSQDIRSQTIVDVKAKGYEKTLVAIKDQTGEVANKTGGGPLQSGTPKLPGDTIDNDKISSKRAKNQRKAANKRRRFEEAGSVYPNPYVNGQTGGSASSQAWALLQQGKGRDQGSGKGVPKGAKGGSKGKPGSKDGDLEKSAMSRVPSERDGKKICRFYNSSAGCRFGDSCRFTHECLICDGQKHAWVDRHYRM